jgi:hypothetical protein
MDRFLLNSNKRCESENKEGTSSTSGKSVKKRKNRKYDESYLDFGFTPIEVDGQERPQCVLYMKVLAIECMLSSKQASIPSNALLASYKVAHRIAEVRSPIQSQKNSFYRLL